MADPGSVATGNDVELRLGDDLCGALPNRWWSKGVICAPNELNGLGESGELLFGESHSRSGSPKADGRVVKLQQGPSGRGKLLMCQEKLAQLG